ncbi:flavin reductase family protein [Flavobacterium difficile]|uniref:Flavin oxidoreductase n=1 Tax=Flavobacterium difficile TaxID=2709659 RepID=A0ABX0I6V2_9FLAO|nr:flavin reductase [Flavobacterium difficile]NHM01865.1 flavin oxidoreductase [Flavobacterium difficile]
MGENRLIKISLAEINEMEKQQRVHFANSLGGFKSVGLIGTQNKSAQTNLAIIDSILHIGSNPPLFGIIFRPGVVPRHTLENILETGFYTINHINENIYKQAHQTSARYDREISEFEVTQLTPNFKNNFFAPFVGESHLQLAMEFKEKIELTINNTVLVIGEVKEVYFPEACLQNDGFLDIEKAASITCSGLDSYHKTTRIDRLSYAKPNKTITSLL